MAYALSMKNKILSCTALSTLVLSMSFGAHAQTTQPAEVTGDTDNVEQIDDNVIVTGFRNSIRSAREVKRNLDFIADVISAEDIGRLPDVSIAESLARLPGVTSQRTGGQASALNIRGFSQELISATLNGREQVSSNGDRSIEFDQYPSELVYQAQVYKSPKASQIEGGIAGKIELQTVSPLKTGKTVFNANLRGSFNDRADQVVDANEFGYRFSASYQTQFANDTIGVAVGYSRLKQANVASRFVGFDFQTGNTFGAGFDPDGDGPLGFLPAVNAGQPVLDLDGDGNGDAVPFGFEAIQFGGDERRDSLLGVVEWQPSNDFHFQVDGFYSDFDTEGFRRGARLVGTQNIQNQGFIVNPNDPSTSLGIATGLPFFSNAVVQGNAITGATFISGNGLDVENVNQDDGDTDELFSIGGKATWNVSDSLTAIVDVSYSEATSFFTNAGITTQAGSFDGAGNFTNLPLQVDFFRNSGNLAAQNFNFDFSDPLTNPVQGFFFVPREDEDELFAISADFIYALELGPFSSFEFGGRYTDRQAVRTVTSFSGPNGDFANAFGLDNPTLVPQGFFQQTGFSGPFAEAGQPDFLAIDIFGTLETLLGINALVPDQNFGFTADQSFTNNEETIAGYGQANLDTEVFGLPMRGNIGLRVVHTEQSSATFSAPGDEAGISFTQFLPSANFTFSVSDNQLIRLAGSRQISRPSFLDIGAGVSAQADTGGFVTGGGGNPALRPFLADQGEIAYEHYFGDVGVFSAGFFYKELDSFIFGGADPNFDFAAAGVAIPPQAPGSQPITSTVGLFTGPVNGEGGNAYGIEVGLTTQFDFLPAPWDGFGVVLNYAYTESGIDLPPSTLSGNVINIPLEGLSRNVANSTIYYGSGGFETRVGIRYRSGFVANQFGLSEQITGFEKETVVDWQASYEFSEDSRLSGLRLLLQANNLTDSGTDSFFGVPAQTGTIQQFGRQFFFGASFTY